MRTGLVSVTFRKLTTEEIISLAGQAKLQGIEWGGDIHVPHGEVGRAREVGRMTLNAGLQVAAYGSYYKVGSKRNEPDSFERIVETAVALGAPMIRVWAGDKGSQDCDNAEFARVSEDLARIADLARQRDLSISLEYHGGTLTDSPDSATRLLKSVDCPNLYSYWQPPVDLDLQAKLASLRQIGPHLSHVHVFHWDSRTRLPLAEGAAHWQEYMAIIRSFPSDRYAMLEFVRDDDPQQLMRDAHTLHELMGR